jgi:hypothetical protein
MTPACRLSVVIAVQHGEQNLAAIMHRLEPDLHPDVEFLFCATDADPGTAERVAGFENVNVSTWPAGSLIPELWREGISAARSETIALGTAHCIPAADWVNKLLRTDMTSTPGIGGMIVNDEASDARDWAIYLLRYISFSPPQETGQRAEIAADNAIYRRKNILEHPDLLKKGFWEPSFHARFRDAGMMLEFDPELRVVHRNRYTTRQFFSQRLAHGRAFGLARAEQLSTGKRILLIALSPLLPIVFMAKIVTGVLRRGGYTSRLLLAFPWLLVFLLGWGLGEAKGYLAAGSGTGRAGEKLDDGGQ